MVMTELNPERRPRPGTKYAVVFDALQAGVPRRDLPEKTGLPKPTVSITIRNLTNDGYLSKPTPEEKRTARSEATSIVYGELSATVQPYVEMGMFPREIKCALDMTKPENKFSVKQIANALGKGRARGDFPKLTQEELRNNMLDAYASEEELERRVRQWLSLRNQLLENGRNGIKNPWLPTNRMEWKISIHAYPVLQEIFRDSQYLLKNLSPEQIVYLEMLVVAREKKSKGDDSGFKDFLDFFTHNKKDGIGLAKTLPRQREAIFKAFPMPDLQLNMQEPIYGEVGRPDDSTQ